ncbi:MAG: abscisic acid-deficient protein Aba4 family protein, partial [Piscinibacter sp.]
YAGRLLPLGLAVLYVAMIATHWRGEGGFGSLAEVRTLFDVPGALAAGWIHYLAFDLFVGAWVAERAGELAMPHAAVVPLLLLTFLFGPAGLLGFVLVRALWRRDSIHLRPRSAA